MSVSKKYAGRLPAHLKRSAPPSGEHPGDEPPRQRRARDVSPEPAAAGNEEKHDRIREVLPVILRALMDRGAGERQNAFTRADVQAVLAPYHRPKSFFTQRVLRRLVGEGYLRPQGGRDKQGYSGAYLLTPAGEKLARTAR